VVTELAAATPLLSIKQLSVSFDARRRSRSATLAVDDVSFDIAAGSTVALVGESGSGKSTIGNAVLGLVRASSGSVAFRGETIVEPGRIEREKISSHIQIVFQDPYGSLNPSRTIGQTMVEPLLVRSRHFDGDREAAVVAALEQVGLSADVARRYPSQFSGGQRQRIAIARAMITSPDLVICDEPVSSLDLSVQAQILNLLSEQQRERHLSYLFISHDLAVVRRVADTIVILYRGRVVEFGNSADVTAGPRHPYTIALLSAAPVPDPVAQSIRRDARRLLASKTSDVSIPTQGCSFAPRCPYAIERCRVERPELRPTPSGSVVACHRFEEIDASSLISSVAESKGTSGARSL
jgi:peptide/nickel transport system ATP-binding protein